MDDDAPAILIKKPMLVRGEKCLKDIRVVEAIFEVGNSGERVGIG